MPPRAQNDKEPLERLKELIGFKWSYVITFLIGLYLPIYGVGFFFGGISARSEMKDTSSNQVQTLSKQPSNITAAEYESIIIANVKERQIFKDSIEALSKKAEVYYRIVKDYKNERQSKK